MPGLRDVKTECRKKHKDIRARLSAEEKLEKDASIRDCLLSTNAFRTASQLLLYADLPGEVGTDDVFFKAHALGKTVFYPKCFERGRMSFYSVDGLDELKTGCFNVREPEISEKIYTPSDSDICIIPALSYDCEGYRMGYGKGFYDRFLSDFAGMRVGICYFDNIEKRLPRGRYDVRVDILITEKGLFRLK